MGRPKKNRTPPEAITMYPPRIGRPLISKGKDITNAEVQKILKTLNLDAVTVTEPHTGTATNPFYEPIRQLLMFLNGQLYRCAIAKEANVSLKKYAQKGITQSPLWPFLELLNAGDPDGLCKEIEQQIRSAQDWDPQFIVGSFLPYQYFRIFGGKPKVGRGGDRSLNSKMVQFISAIAGACRLNATDKTILDYIGLFHDDDRGIGLWAGLQSQSEETPSKS